MFQSVEMHWNHTKYKFDVGDPMHIAAMAYFHPRLLHEYGTTPKPQQPNKIFTENDDFWSQGHIDYVQSLIELRSLTTKKPTKSRKESKKYTENPDMPLDMAIVRCFEKSCVPHYVTKKSKIMHVNIVLVGGLANLKGLTVYLKNRLLEYYKSAQKNKNDVVVNIITNDKDKDTDLRFICWRGGTIMTFLDPIKYVLPSVITND